MKKIWLTNQRTGFQDAEITLNQAKLCLSVSHFSQSISVLLAKSEDNADLVSFGISSGFLYGGKRYD